MDHHQRRDHERQQVVQREETLQGRVADRETAPQPLDDRVADQRNGREQAGDHGGAPERHLAPGQHIAHEGGRHHRQVDQDADDPGDLARRLVGAVVEAPEEMRIDRHEEQRAAVGVEVAQQRAAVHVAVDMLDRGEGLAHMRDVVHGQDDAGGDLQHQAEGQDHAPDPHPVEVLRGRDHQRRVDQADDRQTAVQPALDAGPGGVVIVRDAAHCVLPQPSLMTVSEMKATSGTSRFFGAGPLRMRPEVS